MIQVSQKPPCAASVVVVRFPPTTPQAPIGGITIPTKQKQKPKVEGKRAMLNLPGHHSTAAIVAEVTHDSYGSYGNVQISDCDRKISLDFSLSDEDSFENDLHKIDTLITSLQAFRRAVVKVQKKAATE